MNEEELILNNLPLILKVIKDMRLYWKTEDEFQDFYDAGLEGLIKGAKQYNSNKSKPSTYLITCIRNEICKHLYLSNLDKRRIHKETLISLDKEFGDETPLADFLQSDINVEEEVLKKLEAEKLLNAIDKCLTQKQKEYICKYYGINGYKQKPFEAIAAEENCSRSNVYCIVKKAKRRLKKQLIKEGMTNEL